MGLVFLGTVCWYFLIKPHDYQIAFKTKALPGTINQMVKSWLDSQDDTKFLGQTSVEDFSYEIVHNDSVFKYQWHINKASDSISQVKVYVSNDVNSLKNRMSVLFSRTPFKIRSEHTVMEAMKRIKEHLDMFRVTVVGEEPLKPTYYAYTSLRTAQRQKAGGMMKDYNFLSSVLVQNKIELNGPPFVAVENWDVENDSLQFKFCFPIIRPDTLPKIKNISFGQLHDRKAIKAVYNGNYITSDRAWYHLMHYAAQHNLNVEPKPIEIFYSNPNMGGDELKWKAEVFMPLLGEGN